MSNEIKITADDIVGYLKKDGFNNNLTLGVTEFCPYGEGRRIDLFFFNRWNRETRGYEIKISRADFLQDKKWESYLKFCSWFYFIAPVGIIKAKELPKNIGLIEIEVIRDTEPEWDVEKKELVRVELESYYLKRKFTKKAKWIHDIEGKEYIQLLEGLLVKLIYNKNIIL